MNNMNLPRETINPYEQGGKFYPSPEPPSKEAQEAMRKILSTPAGQLGSLGGGSYTREGYRTWDGRIIPLSKEQEINLEQKLKPQMGGGMMDSNNPYGFTRDPNSVGFQVIVEWYNPSTGETWTAPDSSWRPPNDQWMSRNFPRISPRAQNPAPIKSQPVPPPIRSQPKQPPTKPGQPSFDPGIVTAFGDGTPSENEAAIRSKYGRLPPQRYDIYKGAVYGR